MGPIRTRSKVDVKSPVGRKWKPAEVSGRKVSVSPVPVLGQSSRSLEHLGKRVFSVEIACHHESSPIAHRHLSSYNPFMSTVGEIEKAIAGLEPIERTGLLERLEEQYFRRAATNALFLSLEAEEDDDDSQWKPL